MLAALADPPEPNPPNPIQPNPPVFASPSPAAAPTPEPNAKTAALVSNPFAPCGPAPHDPAPTSSAWGGVNTNPPPTLAPAAAKPVDPKPGAAGFVPRRGFSLSPGLSKPPEQPQEAKEAGSPSGAAPDLRRGVTWGLQSFPGKLQSFPGVLTGPGPGLPVRRCAVTAPLAGAASGARPSRA